MSLPALRFAPRRLGSAAHAGFRSFTNTSTAPARSLPDVPTLDSKGHRKERLVILGSGWGSMSLIKSIDHVSQWRSGASWSDWRQPISSSQMQLQSKYEVVCVSPNSAFNMTPLLASAAVGSLDFRNCMESVRGNGNTQLFHAWADGIDVASKSLLLTPAYPPIFRPAPPHSLTPDEPNRAFPNARGGFSTAFVRPSHRRAIEAKENDGSPEGNKAEADALAAFKMNEEGRQYVLKYDKLVITVGSYNRTFNTPGVRDNAWFLKDVQNARAIRWRIIECFEMADHPGLSEEQQRQLLSFLIVGGGPTGAELSAELHDLIKSDLTRLYPKSAPYATVTIIDASSGILSSFDKTLSDYARAKFARDGIKILLERQVKRVERGRLVVEPDGEIPFGLLVWSTGVCSTPLVKATTCIAKDERNAFLLTDDKLRALAPREAPDAELKPIEDVFAIGDCAQIDGTPLAATAQVAAQKGKYLAKVLNGKRSADIPFKYKDLGAMAALGGGKAIVDTPNAKIHGRIAWFIWRSAYTMMSMSTRNRILVPFFWMVNRIFGRDLSRF